MKKIRKAILTGGGRGTRLHPVTTTINKHLLPLANKPMIFHAIEKVVEAGVTHIYINTNPGEIELQKHIGDGGHWGVNITFFEQTGGPQGIAHVVKQAEKFIGKEPFIFYLSDNILLGSVKNMVEDFEQSDVDCMLALSEVPDPERFGVPIFHEDGKTLMDVWEKPHNPPNNFAVTGIYIYGPNIFFGAFDNIEKSARGEYEISSIHSHFIKTGKKVGYKEITGWWKDTGKPEDLLIANRLLLEHIHENDFLRHKHVENIANIEGKVHIGRGTQIGENVTIKGPVIIGENCVLENCTILPHTTIGSGCEIKHATIKHSIILDNATISCHLTIDNSIIGKSAQLIEKQPPQEKQAHRMILGDKTVIEL
ncbi:MAG: glucose-1-phosphate thymidylyltransferase [Candidatus Magasanikbacteria bacterium]|uniref:Glucose-1-phosphate thymidylyltransferase n=1 Tax=Candidatus Magasanikbacteria bacterium CG10_big_fil_rev_8_21_14_0_10_38_6 TaxID=1974647 RepID=A0A2M6P2H9_9BACT|nr:glucose-1-phosphate thymidylyltransferase [Candidatus Magasanikbacteria bacterium]NCS71737.1 glucose-1-phosphate thymidylyltransferase [Candidatus Magasanikbacteria bacterium]PIR77640.1 MAG: glucose-1-phosphate thymidylyltransferase [Candidatus Magasanikbacteria bacterium CG10_big_fil_rev_8_21_14_0_10_38_6]